MSEGIELGLRDPGTGDILLWLKNFDNAMQRKFASASLRVGAKLIQAGVKENIHNVSGATAAAVKVRAGKSTKNYKAVQVVIGKGWFTGDEWYAAFVEMGHKQGKRSHHERKAARRVSAKSAGAVQVSSGRQEIPGEHFMLYAYQERFQMAIEATLADLRNRIRSEIGKANNAR